MAKHTKELLSIKDVSEILGINVGTTRIWADRGIIPPFKKISRSIRWFRADINAWLTENRPTASPPITPKKKGKKKK